MTDFVVIGGGMAGASAAAHLAPFGQVVLLETEDSLAYHTTGRSAAMKVENYGSKGSRALVRASASFLESPPKGATDGSLLTPRPVLWVADKDGLPHLDEIASSGSTQAQLLSPEEALDHMPVLRPDWVGGGLIEMSGADIDVAALHQAWVRIARSHGADIRTRSPLTSLKRVDNRWLVTTGEESLETTAVINAAGAWGDVVATLGGVPPIGLQPMRRTAFMVPGSETLAPLPITVEVHESWYFKPDGSQILCSLAEETPSEPVDAKPRMEDVALAIDRINSATTLGIRTVNSQWAGLRTFAPDRELVIGADPTAPGFFWLVGQGGIGIQTSPAYGSLLASLVTGEPMSRRLLDANIDPSLTSPARFR